MRYEVFVSIDVGTPPKGCILPQAVSFFVEADNPSLAKSQGIVLAEKMRERHPRKYKGAKFTVSQVKIFGF